MTTREPDPVPGDDKDWSWSAVRACAECGFDPAVVADADLGRSILATSGRWHRVLARDGVRDRPRPDVWSPLEYACHVRDVHRTFIGRVHAMLAEEAPTFADWDQDAAAVSGRYFEQDPIRVAGELEAAAVQAARAYDGVATGGWRRTGLRGDGAPFTVSSLGHYQLHDVEHHLHDVHG